MITPLADFTNGFPASPFAGSVASAVQLGNAAAVPGTRKAEPSTAPETIRYATFRIFSSFFNVSFEPRTGRTVGVGRPLGWQPFCHLSPTRRPRSFFCASSLCVGRVEYRLQAPDHWPPGGIDQDTIANNSYLSFEYRARANDEQRRSMK